MHGKYPIPWGRGRHFHPFLGLNNPLVSHKHASELGHHHHRLVGWFHTIGEQCILMSPNLFVFFHVKYQTISSVLIGLYHHFWYFIEWHFTYTFQLLATVIHIPYESHPYIYVSNHTYILLWHGLVDAKAYTGPSITSSVYLLFGCWLVI